MKSDQVWLSGAFIVIITVLLTVLSAPAEAASTTSKQKKLSVVPLTLKSFSANGLTNEGTLVALFRGDFESIDIKREDLLFEVLFRQYLESYAQKCSDHLPANRVEMTRRRCTTEEVTRNGFGMELSRVCVNYIDEGTGLYAKPDLYTVKREVDRLIAADTLRNAWRLIFQMRQQNSFAGAMSIAGSMQAAKNDIDDLFQLNNCASPGLKRFEDNLRLFALNKQPIRLEGDPKPVMAIDSSASLNNQDYARLIENLVADQARAWAVNRYLNGSVTEVTVSARDAAGRPMRISASYSYEGFNGRSEGFVEVHFTEGAPDCLYFFDAPTSCRTPNRKIVASFAAGPQTGQPASVASNPSATPAVAALVSKPAVTEPTVESASAPAEPSPAPRRELRAVNYVQGIKDACLEVLTGGDRREPETSYCFCLSASAGSIPISEADAQWLFENFSETALGELEKKYVGLVRRFAVCRAQLEASR